MKQAIAFILITLLCVAADGIAETFGPVCFMVVGSVVIGTAYILVREGGTHETKAR